MQLLIALSVSSPHSPLILVIKSESRDWNPRLPTIVSHRASTTNLASRQRCGLNKTNISFLKGFLTWARNFDPPTKVIRSRWSQRRFQQRPMFWRDLSFECHFTFVSVSRTLHDYRWGLTVSHIRLISLFQASHRRSLSLSWSLSQSLFLFLSLGDSVSFLSISFSAPVRLSYSFSLSVLLTLSDYLARFVFISLSQSQLLSHSLNSLENFTHCSTKKWTRSEKNLSNWTNVDSSRPLQSFFSSQQFDENKNLEKAEQRNSLEIFDARFCC